MSDDSRETTPHCSEDGTPGVTREDCPWHPAEPTDELRGQIAATICPGIYCEAHGDCLDDADALLSGPLAPLLAKLRAVEELADEWEAGMRAMGYTDGHHDGAAAIRRALTAPLAGQHTTDEVIAALEAAADAAEQQAQPQSGDRA